MVDTPPPQQLEIPIGTRVEIGGNLGYVRYSGQTSFATGRWVGIELDLPRGKNAGVVEGKRYFECKDKHGSFVRPSQVRIVADTGIGAVPERSQAESAGRSSRPTSITGRSALTSGSRPGAPGRPGASGIGRPQALPGGATAIQPASSASRLTRPSTRRAPGAESTAEHLSGARNTRPSLQPPRDEDRTISGRIPSETPATPVALQQRLQDTLVAERVDDEDEQLLAQERLLQEELEKEEELAQQLQEQEQNFNPTSVTAAVPVPALVQTPNLNSTLAVTPEYKASQEPSVSLKEYDELKIKLRILETKRSEDRERIREAEKVKEESEQFLSIRAKLQAKLSEMQQELRDSKRQLKDSTTEKEAFETKYNDVVEMMEVTMLDKEMAEERAENLQHEVNMLKERVEEMHVDLNVFQQEEANPSNSGVSHVQLERQNERLKEALLRLRDMSSEQEAELLRKIKNLEKEASLVQEVQVQNEKLREGLEMAEGQIEELKNRLDDAIGAEDMIEQLSEKNILLGEKIEEMQLAIEDLEALKELSDELEENHNETEKQLNTEISNKEILIRAHQKKVESLEESVADFENTILQFRDLVASLQSDLEQLRQKEESGGLGSQSQAMLNLNLQLQNTTMRAQAKAIDLELRKLDALQANDNLALVQPYLPEKFFKTENDSIQCLLLFKRLSFKSELMSKHLEQLYSVSEKISQDSIPSQLTSICEVRQKLSWLGSMANRFVAFIVGCPVDVFVRMGQVYHDLIGTERRLNSWVELLRKEELKEADCVIDLQRAISQMDHLAETYLGDTSLDLAERYQGSAYALDLNLDRIFVNLTVVGAMFKSSEDGVRLVDTDDIQYQLLHLVSSLGSQAKSGKTSAKKIQRKIEGLVAQDTILRPESFKRFREVHEASVKLGDFTSEVLIRLARYVQARREGTQTESIHETICNVTDSHLGITENSMWDGCRKLLNGLIQDISSLTESIQDPEIVVKVMTPDKVWIQRAKDMKAEVIVNIDAEHKAQSLQEQVLRMVKDSKMKDQVLQESNLKVELLDKQIDTYKKQLEQMAHLDRDMDKAKKQEKDYDEFISTLQADMAELVEHNTQLRRLIKKFESRNTAAPLKRPTHHSPHGHGLGSPIHEQDSTGPVLLDGIELAPSKDLLIQIESLKSALRFLRSENATLRTRAAMFDLGLSTEMSVLVGPLGRKTEVNAEDLAANMDETEIQKRQKTADSELKAMAVETKRLLQDAREACASPKVVDLSKHTAYKKLPAIGAAVGTEGSTAGRRAWQTQKTLPEWQYHNQQATLNTIRQRSNELKEKLAQVTRTSGHLAPTKLKKLTLADAPIGCVRIPIGISGLVGSPEGTQARKRSDLAVFLRSSTEFEAMHQLFVR